MFRSRIAKHITALFIVAFVCLNVGGAACVAYCQAFDLSKTEHCPLQKVSNHCDKTSKRVSDPDAITAADEVDCCPFAVTFIAAPVENTNYSFNTAAAIPVQALSISPVFVAGRKQVTKGIAYRGPPMDRRIDRLKNCLIRI